jgi:hypothetical protein
LLRRHIRGARLQRIHTRCSSKPCVACSSSGGIGGGCCVCCGEELLCPVLFLIVAQQQHQAGLQLLRRQGSEGPVELVIVNQLQS